MILRLIPLLLLISCSNSVVKEDYPLLERILRPRGDQALTWRRCVEVDPFNSCQKYETETYDITQENVRKRFSQLGFACKINGERFHICEYEGKAGFCQSETKKKWFSKKIIIRQFIGHNEIDRLKDGKAKCFSYRVYNFLRI